MNNPKVDAIFAIMGKYIMYVSHPGYSDKLVVKISIKNIIDDLSNRGGRAFMPIDFFRLLSSIGVIFTHEENFIVLSGYNAIEHFGRMVSTSYTHPFEKLYTLWTDLYMS